MMQNAYLFNYFCKCNDTLPRENGQLVTVDVGIDAMSYGGNVDVAIYDPNGSLVSGISTTPTGTAMISYLTFNTSATGMYEVRVVAAAGAPSGTFSIISMTAIVDLNADKMYVSDLDANVSNDNFLVSLFNVGTTVPVSVVARPGHGYRFGFNGMEKDNEVKGEGNSYDFGARIYDARLGRWLAVDQQHKLAPNWSPYRYAFDNPMQWKDKDGNYEEDGHYWTVLLVATMLDLKNAKDIAYYAELPDHIMNDDGSIKQATNTWLKPRWQKEVHALTGGDIAKERAIIKQKLKAAKIAAKIGFMAHRLGDSYAHADDKRHRMFPKIIGHFFHGKTPDKIATNPDKYMEYVGALTEGLGGENASIDNFVFNYVKNARMDTKSNNEIFKSEFALQSQSTSFNVANDKKDIVAAYLKERSKEGSFSCDISTTKDTNGKETTSVNITYIQKQESK